MEYLHLNSFDWLLIPDKDFQYVNRGITAISSGYEQCASAQGVYYAEGTTTEAERIRSILRPLTMDFPSVDQVRPFLPQIENGAGGLGLYRFDFTDDIWHVRYRYEPRWEHPFENCRWLLLASTNRGWGQLHQVTSVRQALDVFQYLNGEHTAEMAVAKLAGNPEAIVLLQKLLSSGLVVKGDRTRFNVDDVPEFLFLGHSGLMVRAGDEILAIDPVVVPPTRELAGGLPIDCVINHASAVLITHCHWDHLYYQGLARMRRDMRIIVPRVRNPSFANPPMASYVRELGFTNVEERDPWEVIHIGDITLTLVAFYGEPFGLGSQFDGLTYHVRFGHHTLYGSVDACHNEDSDMEAVIEKVAALGPIDYFVFCSSGLHHRPAYFAANLRHFSNELIRRPDLIRFHPTHRDATRWARRLKPRALIPYAEFLFQGDKAPRVAAGQILNGKEISLAGIPATHAEWGNGLHAMARELELPIRLLHPMQGIVA